MIPGSVLALHGFLGHPAALSELQLERHVADVSIPLLLGHGPAPVITAPSFEAEVERLLAHAQRLRPPRRLLGYSQGARLALGLLTAQPQLFERAVLIGGHPGYRTSAERLIRRQVEDGWIARLADEGVTEFVDYFGRLPLFGGPDPDRHETPAYRYQHTADGLMAALLVLGASRMPNLWPQLEKVSLPVELWVGGLDRKFVAIAEEMRSCLPTSHVVVFEGAHHNPLLDASSRVREKMAAWLRS